MVFFFLYFGRYLLLSSRHTVPYWFPLISERILSGSCQYRSNGQRISQWFGYFSTLASMPLIKSTGLWKVSPWFVFVPNTRTNCDHINSVAPRPLVVCYLSRLVQLLSFFFLLWLGSLHFQKHECLMFFGSCHCLSLNNGVIWFAPYFTGHTKIQDGDQIVVGCKVCTGRFSLALPETRQTIKICLAMTECWRVENLSGSTKNGFG